MSSNARTSHTSPVRSRALLAFAVVALGSAAVLTYWSFRPGPEPDAAVLDVGDAVASSTPATVPPLATLPSTSANEPDTDAPEPTGPTTTTIPLSPLAELLGDRGSAVPTEIEPRLRPIGLTIDDIFVDDPVRPVGLEPDGELEVPDATEIGWYRYGAAPGYPGATVLAAHVTWNGDYGPFLNLGDLDPGDQVRVALEDGSERVYEVVERTMYDKDELPRERIWRTTGDETLVLITCGGDFNPDINRYRQNIVIYAVPIA